MKRTVETRNFERPEGTLAYSDYGGDGQLVLMVPGLGALRSEYRTLAPRLKEAGYHAVTVDLRGHGESSVPWKTYDVPSVGGDIVALIEHLDAAIRAGCRRDAVRHPQATLIRSSDRADRPVDAQFEHLHSGSRS